MYNYMQAQAGQMFCKNKKYVKSMLKMPPGVNEWVNVCARWPAMDWCPAQGVFLCYI